MGSGCSRPSLLPVTTCGSGRTIETRDVVINIHERGFSVSSVAIYSRQSVSWRWCEGFHNIMQVTCDGGRLMAVKGGIKSGLQRNAGNFSYEFQIPGRYQFVSQGHNPSVLLDVSVVARRPKTIKLSDDGFSPRYLEAKLGETIIWNWNECVRPQAVRRVYFNSKLGKFEHMDHEINYVAPSICGSYSHTFKSPGIYYFETEASYVSNTTHLCLVKVTNSLRQHKIEILDEGFDHMLLSVIEGDCVWWNWNKRKCQRNHNVKQVNLVYDREQSVIIIDPVAGGYCSNPAQSRTGACRIVYKHPGVTYYTSDGCPDKFCVVVVKPKHSEHVIEFIEEGFKPSLQSISQGDAVQFTWDTTRYNNELFVSEVSSCKPGKKNDNEQPTEAALKLLDWSKIEQLSEVGCFVEQIKEVGVYYFQAKANSYNPQHRELSLLVQPASQAYDIEVSESGFKPNHIQIYVNDQVWWQWNVTAGSCNVVQVTEDIEPVEGGFISGPPTAVGAFFHQFDSPGVYFCTSGMALAHESCVIEVRPKLRLHDIEITRSEAFPNALTICPGDCVCWRWNDDGDEFRIQELSTETINEFTTNGRSYARTFFVEGAYHFLFSSVNESVKSVTSSIIVETPQSSNSVQLSRDGFTPTVTTIAQGDSVTWWWNQPGELHNVFHVTSTAGSGNNCQLVPVDGPRGFSSGKPVANCSFCRAFDEPGTFIVGSDGAPGRQGVIVVIQSACQVAPPAVAGNISNTILVGDTVYLTCLTDDADITYTLDGTYPSLQNDSAEMYDADVGIVFQSPGAFMIRALASKEDMMPSEVMMSSLYFVIDNVTQDEPDFHHMVSNVSETQLTPQSDAESLHSSSMQNIATSNDLALSWNMPVLQWEPGLMTGSGTISWPLLDWMQEMSTLSLFIDGVLYHEMLAFDLNKEGDVVASHKRVELQDLEFDHTYTAVVLARHDESGVVVSSGEMSFMLSLDETRQQTSNLEPRDAPTEPSITDDEKLQQMNYSQIMETLSDEQQPQLVTEVNVEQSDLVAAETQDTTGDSVIAIVKEQQGNKVHDEPSVDEATDNDQNDDKNEDIDIGTSTDPTQAEDIGIEEDVVNTLEETNEKTSVLQKNDSKETDEFAVESTLDEVEQSVHGKASEESTVGSKETDEFAVENTSDDVRQSVHGKASVENTVNITVLDDASNTDEDEATSDKSSVEGVTTVGMATDGNTITATAAMEDASLIVSAPVPRLLSKLWIGAYGSESIQFAWEAVAWDFSDGGSLLLRIEGRTFSSDVDSVSTYVSDSHGDLEDDILSEGLRVHSWKLARVDSNVSVSGCLPGCSYKAWLCTDVSTGLLSESIQFTVPLLPDAPVLKILDISENEVTLSWLGVHLNEGAVLDSFQVYKNGKTSGPVLSNSVLTTKVSGFEEDLPDVVSVAAIVLQSYESSSKQTNVERLALHSEPVTICKPVRPLAPQLTHQPVDQYGAICIAWKMVARPTVVTAFDILVDGISYQTVPIGCTVGTSFDGSAELQEVSSQHLSAETSTEARDSVQNEEVSANNGQVETQHSFVLTNCQPRKASSVAVVALVGGKVMEMESGRAVLLPRASLESNCVSVICASVPNPPKVKLENVDHLGISFNWERPDEFGEAKISGYLVEINKHRQVLLNENEESYLLSDCEIGRKYHFTVTALTEHRCRQGNATASNKSLIVTNVGDLGYEADTETSLLATPAKAHRSHTEVSNHSSLLLARYPGCLSSQPLTVRYSGFVLPPADLAVSELHASSVVISWVKGQPPHVETRTTKEQRWADMPKKAQRHVLEPEKFLVRWWKINAQAVEQAVDDNSKRGDQKDETVVCKTVVKALFGDSYFVVLSPLETQTKYCVTIESQARLYCSPHSTRYLTLKARSEPFEFSSAQPPTCVSDLHIIAVSFTQVVVSWSPPVEKGIVVKCLEVTVQSIDGGCCAQKIIRMPASTCSVDCLNPNSQYIFTVCSHTKTMDEVKCEGRSTKYPSLSASIVANTLGLTPAGQLKVVSRNYDSTSVTWCPATPHGPVFIDKYVIQWREASSGLASQMSKGCPAFDLECVSTVDICRDSVWSSKAVSCEDCNCTIGKLISGLMYCCRVVTVLKSTVVSIDACQHTDDATETIPSTFWYVGDLLYFRSSVTVGKPQLLISAYSTSDIQLYWPKPEMQVPVQVDNQGQIADRLDDYNPQYKGVVSVLASYRVNVDGLLLSTLHSEQNKYIVTGKQPGTEYRLTLDALSYGEGTRKRKSIKGKRGDDSLPDDFDIATSDEVVILLPDLQKHQITSLACHFTLLSQLYEANDLQSEESLDSNCACGVIAVEWQTNEKDSSLTAFRKFVVHWSSDKDLTDKSVSLSGSAYSYNISSPKQRHVYSVIVEAVYVDMDGTTSYMSPAVHCQVPGPPDPPQLWLHAATDESFTIAWSEPQTYGNVKIKGYQTYLNGKKAGNLLDTVHRKAAIPYRKHKLYEVTMVAVSDSRDFGDSPPSHPVLIEGATLFTMSKPMTSLKKVKFEIEADTDGSSLDTNKVSGQISSSLRSSQQTKDKQKSSGNTFLRSSKLVLQVNCVEVTANSISLDWKEFIASNDVVGYEIQWSSVASPASKKVAIRADEQSHVLTNCQMGTSYFIRVVALGDKNFTLARSKQLTIQTAAPTGPPNMTVKSVNGCDVLLSWEEPELFGPTHLIGYKLQIECEGSCKVIELNSNITEYQLKCQPCLLHTFSVKGVTAECGDSANSSPLTVVCDGVLPPQLTRVATGTAGTIKVCWNLPTVQGNIKIRSYQIFWLSTSNSNVDMSVSQIIEDPAIICHGPQRPSTFEDQLTGITTGCCWVVIAVHSSQAEVVYSIPLKAYTARRPEPPTIIINVVNLDDRKTLETTALQLISQRDGLQLKLHWQKSKQSRKSVKKREKEVSKLSQTLAAVEKELMNCLKALKRQTGYASVCVQWERPWDDGDATVTGYQLIVDGSSWGKQLPSSANDVILKLGISNPSYQVQLIALTEHSVGNSIPSNTVSVSTVEFQPFSFYCFSNVHKENSEWPDQGSCLYMDSLTYELTRLPTTSSAVYPHLGFLAPHPLQSPCRVISLSNGKWNSLIAMSADIPKPSVVLFWTRWCRPSLTVMKHFVHLADDMHDECCFVACCVDVSGMDSHLVLRQLVQQTVTEQNWDRTPDVLQHAITPRRSSSEMESLLDILGIVGVPTWVIFHPSGYVGWQGRIVFESYKDLKAYVDSVVDMVLGRKD